MTRVTLILNTISICLAMVCSAQNVVHPPAKSGPNHTATTVLSDGSINISNYINIPQGSELVETFRITSPMGIHITYSQYIQQKEVLYAGAKLHIKNNGTYSLQDYMCQMKPSGPNLYDYWLPAVEGIIAVSEQRDNDPVYPKKLYKDASGKVVAAYEITKHIRKDTTLFSKVFAVNPINSANAVYGGDFIDNNDTSNATLEAEMRWVQNTVQFENDSFILESEFLRFRDLSNPVDLPYYIFNDSVSIDRQDDHFEYLNVYYHINQVGDYVKDIGYGTLIKKLDVDVHSYGGEDNSGYVAENHTLLFGDGGVDDGEDGEVVIHEFTHSLSEMASPKNTIGKQREAMEEGSSDYFSKAYSRTYNDNTQNEIFSWDGHNPFWNGFNINTNRLYPRDLKNSKDLDRDMWSSALMCIHDSIGRGATDSLVLEHFFYQYANATMPDMARIILKIDSADFSRKNYSHIKGCFVDAGFLEWTVSVDTKSAPSPFSVLNQEGFANGLGNLSIPLPSVAAYTIYNGIGEIVSKGESALITLKAHEYGKGLYVIHMVMNNTMYSQKVVR